jgi:hypothetical protein
MHVTIKKLRLKKRGATIIAELRRSYRRGGQPRHELVCYLGSIREQYIPFSSARTKFWSGVSLKLAALNLPDYERQRLAAKIADSVPCP